MDKDRVKGAINDAAGRAKRQVEWTDNTNAQVEGSAQQLKGKAQKAWGTVKDAAREASESVKDASKTRMEHEGEMAHERDASREQERERVHSGHDH
jgi:uncharacterized protein YjbJ (UPF0337 family)